MRAKEITEAVVADLVRVAVVLLLSNEGDELCRVDDAYFAGHEHRSEVFQRFTEQFPTQTLRAIYLGDGTTLLWMHERGWLPCALEFLLVP